MSAVFQQYWLFLNVKWPVFQLYPWQELSFANEAIIWNCDGHMDINVDCHRKKRMECENFALLGVTHIHYYMYKDDCSSGAPAGCFLHASGVKLSNMRHSLMSCLKA